jgi:hypothetical protein
MTRFAIAATLVVIAVVIALLLERRKPPPPTQARWAVPTQLDRADFPQPDVPWLVVVFTSETCDSCRGTASKAVILESPEVAVDVVSVQARPDLHRRYAIDAVPTIVVADTEGVVRASFVGPPTATDLWAAVAEAREPGSSPEPSLGQGEPPAPA